MLKGELKDPLSVSPKIFLLVTLVLVPIGNFSGKLKVRLSARLSELTESCAFRTSEREFESTAFSSTFGLG